MKMMLHRTFLVLLVFPCFNSNNYNNCYGAEIPGHGEIRAEELSMTPPVLPRKNTSAGKQAAITADINSMKRNMRELQDEGNSSRPSSVPSISATTTTAQPSFSPSLSIFPTARPSLPPSLSIIPTTRPSLSPSLSILPTTRPSLSPSLSILPTARPSLSPSLSILPTARPSLSPSLSILPTTTTTTLVSFSPSAPPSSTSSNSTNSPRLKPIQSPTEAPSSIPTVMPSSTPSISPSSSPTSMSSVTPTVMPSSTPSVSPNIHPTNMPSESPSVTPTSTPSIHPTSVPSISPTNRLSSMPSAIPSTASPTNFTSETPSTNPSVTPTAVPTQKPSQWPSVSVLPSRIPSDNPSISQQPSISARPTQKCFTDWRELTEAVDDAVDNDTFFVCPQTTLVPEEYGYKNNTYSDIWVKQDNISILCARDGDNRNSSDYCVFEGGISHVYIRGDNAYFEGFLFEGATDGSVRAWGEQTANYVTFVDCVWRDNRGDVGSAISIWHTYEELGVAQNVKLVRCSFEENTSLYAGSAVLNEGGTLVVKDSIFIENKGGWPIEVSHGGKLSISSSCFNDNPGAVFIYEGSQVTLQTFNFGIHNNGDLYDCEGSFLQESNECAEFTAQTCLADIYLDSPIYPAPITSAPTPMPPTSFTLSSEPTTTGTPLIPASQPSSSPTSKNYFCYDNWQDLAYKIERSYGNETFVVCPGATFRPSLEETIKAYAPNISLMCGYDGAISNNCAFDGGKTHLSIPGGKKVTHLFVSGFVFRNASKTSIVAFGGEKAIAIFHDCFWENNAGEYGGAVDVYHNSGSGVAMSLFFEDCVFTGNEAIYGAAIMIERGIVTVMRCRFEDNLLGWPIEVNGELILEDSCFLTNNGAVYVWEGGQVTFSKLSNFASGNLSPLADYKCEGVYDEGKEFPRNCEEFKADQCMATQYMSITPTISPSINPTPKPSSAPAVDSPNNTTQITGGANHASSTCSVILVLLLSLAGTWNLEKF